MTSLGRVLAAAAAVIASLGIAACASTGTDTPASAQRIDSGALGTFGQVNLREGFMPDPHVTTVNAGGPIDVATVSDRCAGFIAERPSFTLNYNAGDLPLYVGVVADADTTLVVRGPDGQYMCDDDSGDDLNPIISWDNPRSGRYQIWVGRFGTGDLVPAALYISEVSGPANEVPANAPDFTLAPNYGAVELASGFQPDPHNVAVQAGGSYNAYQIPECVGWISSAPDYRVTFSAGTSGLPLIFSAQSDSDTTLVVNDANGNWVCNDDTNGLNPQVTFANPESGQYDVWVGTFSEGATQPSTLSVSEIASQ